MATDEELLTLWRSGNEQAGIELFDRYFAAIFRFFRNKVEDAAEDLTQQTFVACVKGRDVFRGQSSFRTYIFSIARKRLYSHVRMQRPNQELFDFANVSLANIYPTSPTSFIAKKQQEQLLLKALRFLPIDMQVALELYYWEELSIQEISEILETPSGTVKRRLQRARQRLEGIMEQQSHSQSLFRSTVDDFNHWIHELRKNLV